MQPKHTGIPTTYRAILFRSRLEARWAAFFDLLRWKWDYEPIDLPGWIPDFVVHLRERTLVEVKPHFELDLEVTAKIENACRAAGRTEKLMIAGLGVWWWRVDWQRGDLVLDEKGIRREVLPCPEGRWIEQRHMSDSLAAKWAEAGNITQWRSAR